MPPAAGPPVVLGSSTSGILVSLALSRAGIEHVVIGGGPPPPIPRLGESLNDCASPEIWRLYGHEFPEHFQHKNHICYFSGNFSAMIHLANPRRRLSRVAWYAPTEGDPRVPPYPWFGDGLFHLDRAGFDVAIYHKARARPECRFITSRVRALAYDGARDTVERIEFEDGSVLERPRYVFDVTGERCLVGEAAGVGRTLLSRPQRVVFTHMRRAQMEAHPAEFWRRGTNLMRLDRSFDGVDGLAWVIAINRALSIGMSVEAGGPLGDADKDELMRLLVQACQRRGLDVEGAFPEMVLPVQELRHTYFKRDRAAGANWLLVGPTYLTVWFNGSTGLWTVCAAASLAPRLLERPELGRFYERSMENLIGFHRILGSVIERPTWKHSIDVYRFFARGTAFIISRVNWYLRIKNRRTGWFRPFYWPLDLLALLAHVLPTVFFILIGGMALVHVRLEPDRRRQGRPFPLYTWVVPFRVANFLRSLPLFLWALVPRRERRPHDQTPEPRTGDPSEHPNTLPA